MKPLPSTISPVGVALIRAIALSGVPSIVFVAIALLSWPLTSQTHPDLGLYFRVAELVASGNLPYRDFRFEYPPFALVPCVAPLVWGGSAQTPEMYRLAFLFFNAAYLMVIARVVQLIIPKEGKSELIAMAALAIPAGILAPFLAWRYDLFPAMLTALAFLGAVHRKPLFCGALLGLAISAKLYPVVLVPIFALWFARFVNKRSAVPLVLGVLTTVALTLLPFCGGGLSGIVRVFTFHSQRGIHIESLSGGLILLMSSLAGEVSPTGVSFGAWHLVSPAADALAVWHGPLFVVLFGIFLAVAWRFIFSESNHRDPTAQLGLLSLGALLVFIVSNKVLSPQYLAWMFPFVPFFRIKQLSCFVLVCLASTFIFPFGYNYLLAGNVWIVLLLNARNLLIVGLLFWIAWDFTHSPPERRGSK